MTNPAVEVIPDEPTADTAELTENSADSFLADFDSVVLGKESIPSEQPERSSEPTPDAAEPSEAGAPKDQANVEDGDPAQTSSAPEANTVQYQPVTYTVNGQEKQADWAVQVGNDGVVIPAEHVARFKDLIQRDEWQNAQNRELYRQNQQYESVAHKIGDTEFKGLEAVRQMQADVARLDASGGRVLQALADPDFVTNLAIAYQNGNQAEVQQTLARVLQEVRFAGERAQFDTLKKLDGAAQEATRSQEMAQTTENEYRNIIVDFGKALPELTPDDLQAMYSHFGAFRDRIFRAATLDEAKQLGVRPGDIIKDPTVMHEWAKDRANLRRSMAQSATAAQQAARENAARQAGQRPGAKKTAKPSSGKKPTRQQAPDALFDGDDGSFSAWQKRLMAGKWAHDDLAGRE